MGNELEVHTAALSLPVSVAGGLWPPRTPLLLGYRVHIIRELWRITRERFSLEHYFLPLLLHFLENTVYSVLSVQFIRRT